ncbi:pyridoxamine 5'-phosphate oxidase family protein [Amycolatopsis sp. SID8362]|uniref:pyridoxamine 5'-phosphate oxidase family protein n=1 Tax=Amycolatopsis sp. SID8362 TaxID=2690346 RepID=UPI0013715796|nr:pyridoxamine 5'-phosphate oxidase family protein [Amycolatopsis sp. SID8362]NBH01651.1 pyridoxamine 5'-phosphate oxidase [Amycolatopsis sp. SID8362]NED38352.1 pyridoxamine 5'-phosphate oxidase [Amycolatopsis sp. SID8362]
MSRRDQIRMTEDEVREYLAGQKVINVASVGPNGRPHLAPLWYFPHEDGVATWTYGTSQKAKNLRRLAQATVLVEDGDSYEKLRGVSFEADVEIVEDTAEVTRMGIELMQRYAGAKPGDPVPDELKAFIAGQAPKRIGLIFRPTKVASWNHGKLGGTY